MEEDYLKETREGTGEIKQKSGLEALRRQAGS